MYQETKETPVTGLLGPEIRQPRFKQVVDAIRKGCEMYPKQARAALYGAESACALGAAIAGGITDNDPILSVVVYYPLKGKSTVKNTLRQVMVHLNDHSRWTREKIANWLETLE